MKPRPDTREPEEIERDLNRARAQVNATIDAIQQRLAPGELMDQAYHYLRHSAPADFGANLGHTARRNPVPVTLIGVGIAWLMAQGRRGMADGAAARARADAAEDGWDATYGRPVDDAADATGSDAIGRARRRAGEFRDRSRERIESARDAVSGILDEQPLVLGALGLALGAALGAALPATRREDARMGEHRDDLLDRMRRSPHDAADSIRQTARRSDAARERAADERRGDYPARPQVDDDGAFPSGSPRRMDGLL